MVGRARTVMDKFVPSPLGSGDKLGTEKANEINVSPVSPVVPSVFSATVTRNTVALGQIRPDSDGKSHGFRMKLRQTRPNLVAVPALLLPGDGLMAR